MKKNPRGVTLPELLVCMVLMAGIAIGVNAMSILVYKMVGVSDQSFIAYGAANVALETVAQRVMRAPPLLNVGGSPATFQVDGDGHGVTYYTPSGSFLEHIYQVGSELKFDAQNSPGQVLLKGLQSAQFTTLPGGRMRIELKFLTRGKGLLDGNGVLSWLDIAAPSWAQNDNTLPGGDQIGATLTEVASHQTPRPGSILN